MTPSPETPDGTSPLAAPTAGAPRLTRRGWTLLAGALLLTLGLGANAVYRALPNERRPYGRTDLPVYVAGAERALAGEDPFGATCERGWPYVYPPTLAALLTPLVSVPRGPAAAAWYLVGALAFAAGAWSLRRALLLERGEDPRIGWRWREDGLPLALVALPTASALLRGQVGPLLLGLVGGAALCLARRRGAAAGLLLALATAIKLTPGWVLIGLLAGRRWRAVAGGVAGLILWLVLVPAPLLGVGGALDASARFADRMVLRYVRDPGSEALEPAPDLDGRSDTSSGVSYDVHIPTNQSLTSQVIRRVDGPPRTLLLVALAAVVACASLALGLRPARARRARGAPGRPADAGPAVEAAGGDAGPGVRGIAALALAPLIVAPVSWHHHHVLALPALLVLATVWSRAARAALAAFGALSLAHFALGFARPLGLLGLGTLALLGGLLLAREWNPQRAGADGL